MENHTKYGEAIYFHGADDDTVDELVRLYREEYSSAESVRPSARAMLWPTSFRPVTIATNTS